MLEAIVVYSLAIWMVFFLVNHAEMFNTVRAVIAPKLPRWLKYSLSCALCFGWWTCVAVSLFFSGSFALLNVCCPPAVLFLDLSFRRLRGDK